MIFTPTFCGSQARAVRFQCLRASTPRCLWLLHDRESHANMLSDTQYDPGAAMIMC